MNSLVRLVLPDVRDLLRDATNEDIQKALAPFHAADIADLIEELDDDEASALLLGLGTEKQVETFEQLELPQQIRLVESLGPEGTASIVEAMAHDDRADLVSELPQQLVSGVLNRLPPEEAKDVALLATYPDETAGGIMTSDFLRLSVDDTAAHAIEEIREQSTGLETILALYVLDAHERLVGVVSLTNLILCPAKTPIKDVMYANPISVTVDTDQETVVNRMRHYDFLAMPVVDPQGKMVGIITHDDILDVAHEEADEDAQRQGGMQPLEAPYFATHIVTLIRKRAVWLTVLFVAGLVAGSILKGFESTLEQTMALIFFLPLIIAAGGNTGSQSATLVIRGLAVGEMKIQDWWRIAKRELVSGLALGTLLGSLGITVAVIWQVDGWTYVAVTVWLTLVAIVTVGSLLGCLLPLGLAKVNIDPAITSSPLVAGLVDILGILVYVLIAKLLIPAL